MKIRIHQQSVRLRLSTKDVEEFTKNGLIKENLIFGEGQSEFGYELKISKENSYKIRFIDSVVSIEIPKEKADHWLNPNEVGFHFTQETGEHPIKVIIEKDFQCLVPRPDENEELNFPNPAANH